MPVTAMRAQNPRLTRTARVHAAAAEQRGGQDAGLGGAQWLVW
jgi:hypothetical protein